jgi:hypothetical protein
VSHVQQIEHAVREHDRGRLRRVVPDRLPDLGGKEGRSEEREAK